MEPFSSAVLSFFFRHAVLSHQVADHLVVLVLRVLIHGSGFFFGQAQSQFVGLLLEGEIFAHERKGFRFYGSDHGFVRRVEGIAVHVVVVLHFHHHLIIDDLGFALGDRFAVYLGDNLGGFLFGVLLAARQRQRQNQHQKNRYPFFHRGKCSFFSISPQAAE